VALTREGLRVIDLFEDRRKTDAEVARLAARVIVVKDDELDEAFPNRYETIVEVTSRAGGRWTERNGIARGYPEAPLPEAEIRAKFDRLAGAVASAGRRAALADAIAALWSARDVSAYAELMRGKPDAAS
jgi:2-methylcitrate dehydratase PrpD